MICLNHGAADLLNCGNFTSQLDNGLQVMGLGFFLYVPMIAHLGLCTDIYNDITVISTLWICKQLLEEVCSPWRRARWHQQWQRLKSSKRVAGNPSPCGDLESMQVRWEAFIPRVEPDLREPNPRCKTATGNQNWTWNSFCPDPACCPDPPRPQSCFDHLTGLVYYLFFFFLALCLLDLLISQLWWRIPPLIWQQDGYTLIYFFIVYFFHFLLLPFFLPAISLWAFVTYPVACPITCPPLPSFHRLTVLLSFHS